MNRFMMRRAQELGTKLAKVQEELEKVTVEASSGGGAVTVVVNGQQRVQSVKISPEVMDAKDMELVEDLVMAAVNEAIAKSQELAQSRLGALTGGLKIPGLT